MPRRVASWARSWNRSRGCRRSHAVPPAPFTLADTADLGYNYDAITVGTFDAAGEWKVWLPHVPVAPVPGRLRALAADG